MKRMAYCTMLTSGDAYVPGVEALGRSLQKTGTAYPMVLMTTAEVSAEKKSSLAAQGWIVREVEPIANPAQAGDLLYPRFASVFTKLRAWQLVEYDKLVFLDADTIVLKNIDELFERPAIAAAPDFFAPDHFNSGAMVLDPSQETFAAMMEALSRTPTYDGGDQGFLNTFFKDWYAAPVEHRLPIGYNTHHFIYQFLDSHPSLRRQYAGRVRIVHYTLQKPWLLNLMLSGGSEIWWKMYFDVHPEKDRPWKRRLHAAEDRLFSGVVGMLGG